MKAWLGGYGVTHTDRLSQQVTLPATASGISLQFHLHISTAEESTQAFDKLRVRVRDTNGQLLTTLKVYSNLEAVPGFTVQSLRLTRFKGARSGSSWSPRRTTARRRHSWSTTS